MRVLNLEHDLCLATEEVNFIPPGPVVEFARRCRWLERFMRAPEGEEGRIVPWGWNMQLRERLIKEGVPEGELPAREELEFIKENSRREVAVELLAFLNGISRSGSSCVYRDCIPTAGAEGRADSTAGGGIFESISPGYRIVAHSLQEIEGFLQEKGKVVLKAPLSGSGKGVRFVTNELMETDIGWCRRVLARQGAVIVEERLDVVQEFAMLFEVSSCSKPECADMKDMGTKGAAGMVADVTKFVGYSMFYASNGAYKGNLLASNEYIEEFLGGDIGRELLVAVKENIKSFLSGRLAGRYTGFVGVDMFIYRNSRGRVLLNPAVEINMRMTMGLIARNIYDFHREEFQLGEGTHCFEPERGIFPIEQ
ncbi:MAG: hypothetical protein E7122_06840 [Bacteroidales bacterium]|nr:hypothetical protein [Bacteroidales bacterium]